MRRAFTVAAAAVVILAGVAAAQPPGGRLPRDAVVVAGPTESGARLFVYDRGGAICGSPRRPRARAWSEGCGLPSGRLRDPTISFHEERGRPLLVWGLVAPSVASVEIVFAGGARVAADTTDGAAYRGAHAGRVRFFLLEAPRRGGGVLYLRLVGSDGSLLAAVDATHGGGARSGRIEVGRGRVGRLPWSLSAFTSRVLVPLPGEEERVVTRTCVALAPARRPSEAHVEGRTQVCDDPDFPARPEYDALRTCSPIGLQVIGLLPPGVGRVVAVLGDGTRRRLPLWRLPAAMGRRRAFALAIARDVALRSLVLSEGGRRRRVLGGIGPGVADCPDSSTGYLFGFHLLRPRFGAEPPALKLRDEGTLLCATLGLPDPRGRDCARPPVDELDSRIMSHPTAAGTMVAGVVPAHVWSVELLLGGTGARMVPTTVEAPYAGRYRGVVRVFSVLAPKGDEPRRITLNGIDAKPLVSLPVAASPSFESFPRTVLRARSGWRLGAGVVRGGPGGQRFACLQLARGSFSREPLGCALGFSRNVNVICRPRGMLIYGLLHPGVRGLEVVTSRGRFRARTAALGRHGFSGEAFLVELPARAEPRSIVTRVPRPRRQHLRLPTAARQCGYQEDVTR